MSEDLTTKVAIMAQDINYIKEELHEIKELVKSISEKKADRWVEKAIVGVVIFVLSAVGTALLALIFR